MAKKKFGANGLNAVDVAAETVSASVAENQESSQTVASTPTQVTEPEVIIAPAIATESEQTPKQTTPKVEETPAVSVQPVEQPASPPQPKLEELEAKIENTKGLNIPLPVSIYKRLSTMKINSDDESLKSLGLKAIIEFLEKNEY